MHSALHFVLSSGGLSIPTWGKVVTATSCDVYPVCRSVLMSLPEARARVKPVNMYKTVEGALRKRTTHLML